MKDKQQSYFVNIGSSFLLVIFLILCLVTFAVLSLSGAKSDCSFSERLAEHRKAYYESSARAEDIVAEIDSILCKTAHNVSLSASSGEDGGLDLFDDYLFAVSSALNGTILEDSSAEGTSTDSITVICEKAGDEFLLSFQVPTDEKQELQVVLRVTDFRIYDTYYEIKTWKTVNTDN